MLHTGVGNFHFPSSLLHAQMPYYRRRRSFGRRSYGRYGRRKSYRRSTGGSSAYRVAKRALAVAKRSQSILRADREVKEYSAFQTLTASNTEFWYLLNNTEQGDDEGNRQGESITGSYVHLKGRVLWGSAPLSTDAVRSVRVLLIRQRSNPSGSSTAPTAVNILDWTGLSANQANLAPYNKEQIGNFDVMWDELMTITAVSRPVIDFDKKFKTKFVSKYVEFTALDDWFYTNRLFLVFLECGVFPSGTGDGAMSYEFKSSFFYNR